MDETDYYTDVKGISLDLSSLDAEERTLVDRVVAEAKRLANWNHFDNAWLPMVASFYRVRGLNNKQIIASLPYRIAQDQSGRLAIAEGMAREPDYVSEIEELVRTKFPNRKDFCAATGISESMLCHVLHRRKDLGLATLMDALKRIGYELHIRPSIKA